MDVHFEFPGNHADVYVPSWMEWLLHSSEKGQICIAIHFASVVCRHEARAVCDFTLESTLCCPGCQTLSPPVFRSCTQVGDEGCSQHGPQWESVQLILYLTHLKNSPNDELAVKKGQKIAWMHNTRKKEEYREMIRNSGLTCSTHTLQKYGKTEDL